LKIINLTLELLGFVKSCTSIFDIPPVKQSLDDTIYLQRPICLHKPLVKHF